MVWITKRELAYYFILKHTFRDRIFNLGEAFDILIIIGSKNTARKIMKKLTLLGFLEKIGDINYRVRDLEQVLFINLRDYMIQRLFKRIRLLGFSADFIVDGGREKLIVRKCDEKLKATTNLLRDIIGVSIECVDVDS